MKIEKINDDVTNLDIKRCYLPFIVSAPCPKCGIVVERDLANDYISYPKTGRSFPLHMVHDLVTSLPGTPTIYGEHEFNVLVRLDLELSAVNP